MIGPAPVPADTVHLMNGQSIRVESCRPSGEEILCRRAGGVIGLPREQVRQIVPDAPPPVRASSGEGPPTERRAAAGTGAPPVPAQAPLASSIVISAETAAVIPEGASAWRSRIGELERSLGRPGVDEKPVRREMAVLHTYLGNEAAEQGDFEAAESAYLRATDEDPLLEPPRLNLVRLRLQEGRNYEAEGMLARVQADHPGSAAALALQGEVAYRSGRIHEAIEHWERSLAIKPDPDLDSRLARIRREGRAEEGFFRTDGAHFILKYDGDRASDALSQEIVAHLDAAFEDLTIRYHVLPSSPIIVTLYSREAFHDVTESPRWVGGLFDGQIRIPIGGLTRLTEVARDVFTHELTHCIVFHKTRGNCPKWLQEGIAQLSEGKSALSQRRALARQFAGASASDAAESFSYPQALSMLEHFLDTWTASHLLDILDSLGRGGGFEQAFEATTGRTWLEFVDSWLGSLHTPGGVG